MQTHSEENYLKEIYLISRQGEDKVSVTALAVALGNNPASVIDMIKKLIRKKLIKYDKNTGARLTGQGLKAAIQTIRKHRLWEMFLQEKLGYTWEEVHEIAEQLEHVHDDYLADRLDAFLGYPQYDPHGEAIPNPRGKMPDEVYKTLFDVEIGKTCRVISVKDTSRAFLQYLRHLNINIGTLIKVLDKISYDDSLTILIGKGEKATISKKLAASIFVGVAA